MNDSDRENLVDYVLGRSNDSESAALERRALADPDLARRLRDLWNELESRPNVLPINGDRQRNFLRRLEALGAFDSNSGLSADNEPIAAVPTIPEVATAPIASHAQETSSEKTSKITSELSQPTPNAEPTMPKATANDATKRGRRRFFFIPKRVSAPTRDEDSALIFKRAVALSPEERERRQEIARRARAAAGRGLVRRSIFSRERVDYAFVDDLPRLDSHLVATRFFRQDPARSIDASFDFSTYEPPFVTERASLEESYLTQPAPATPAELYSVSASDVVPTSELAFAPGRRDLAGLVLCAESASEPVDFYRVGVAEYDAYLARPLEYTRTGVRFVDFITPYQFEEFDAAEPAPVVSPVAEEAVEPVAAPVAAEAVEPVASPATEEAIEPVASPATEEAVEHIASPIAEEAVEPVAAPIAEVAVEPVAAPIAEVAVEPVVAPAVEEAVEPVASPIAEEAVEPVASPVAAEAVAPVASPVAEVAVEPVASPVAEVILPRQVAPPVEREREILPVASQELVELISAAIGQSPTYIQQNGSTYVSAKPDAEDEEALVGATVSAENLRLAELLGREPTVIDLEEYYWEDVDSPEDADDYATAREPGFFKKLFYLATSPPVLVGRATIRVFRAVFPRDLERNEASRETRRQSDARAGGLSDMVISLVAGIVIAACVVFPLLRKVVREVYITIAESTVREYGERVTLPSNEALELDVTDMMLIDQILHPSYESMEVNESGNGEFENDGLPMNFN